MAEHAKPPPQAGLRGAIDPGVSSYLNLLRIVAALTVLLGHYLPTLFGIDIDIVPSHEAVIVFFVMSGYVIAYVAATRDRPLERFVIHRLARLWSVLIPALALAVVAAVLVPSGTRILAAPAVNTPVPFLSASLKNLLFVGEGWLISSAAPYNLPVWSLNFEAWYYAIFAALVFAPRRWRWRLAGVLAIVSGPRVLPLFPCWLLGAWLYRRHAQTRLQPGLAYLVFGASLALFALACHFGLALESRHWLSVLTAGQSYHIGASNSLIGDAVLSLLVAATILVLPSMPAANRWFVRARRLTEIAASRTLSLYLFHMPLLAILYGGLGLGRDGAASAALCLVLGIGAAVFLGSVTEARLPAWRRVLWRISALVWPRVPRAA